MEMEMDCSYYSMFNDGLQTISQHLGRIAAALEILCDINDPDERFHRADDVAVVAIHTVHDYKAAGREALSTARRYAHLASTAECRQIALQPRQSTHLRRCHCMGSPVGQWL